MFCSDISRAIRFYHAVVGLRLSDRSGDGVAFMHGIHGSDHHMVAFAKSDGPGLHHLSWDVGSIHEVGLGAMQMADRGFSAGWGMGRHVLGSNYFHYVRDPWGSYASTRPTSTTSRSIATGRRATTRARRLLRLGPEAAGRLRGQLRDGDPA